MGNEQRYFYLGGLLSLGLFCLFSALFIILLFQSSKPTSYALKKDRFISVSVVVHESKPAPKKQHKVIKQEVVSAPATNNNIDVNDLFSDVWTPKIETKPKKKKVNSKRIQEISKRIKTSTKKHNSSLSQKLQNIQEVQSFNEHTTSTAEEVNEYLAKIQAVVYESFHPPVNSQGSVVRIVIELDALGKMRDFRVLNYSNNDALNQEADRMKQRLLNVLFPPNPDGKLFRAIINLIPENKESM